MCVHVTRCFVVILRDAVPRPIIGMQPCSSTVPWLDLQARVKFRPLANTLHTYVYCLLVLLHALYTKAMPIHKTSRLAIMLKAHHLP
jgi:hypothetical protein